MKVIIRFLFLLQVAYYLLPITPAYAQQEKQTVLDVILHQEQNSLTITSVGKRQGFAPDNLAQRDGYYLQVFDSNGKRINEVRFRFPQGVIIDFPTESTAEIPPQETGADITVTIPYPENGQKLVVLSPEGNELLTYNLGVFKAVEAPETAKSTFPTKVVMAAAALLVIILAALMVLKGRKTQSPPTTPPAPTNTPSAPPNQQTTMTPEPQGR